MARSPISNTASASVFASEIAAASGETAGATGSGSSRGVTPNRSASSNPASAALVREPASRASDRTSPGGRRK